MVVTYNQAALKGYNNVALALSWSTHLLDAEMLEPAGAVAAGKFVETTLLSLLCCAGAPDN